MDPTCFVLYVVLTAVLWVFCFAQLMTLGDDLFPGRLDKVLWVAAFVLVFPLAPFAFMWWKRMMLGMRAEEMKQ
jgi:hypothetical protein